MNSDRIPELIRLVQPEEMRTSLFYLAKDPLPMRKLCLTLPGHEKCTLYEADDYIQGKLEGWGYEVEKEGVQVQSYRRDITKNPHHQYSKPEPDDPWYTAYNLYAKKVGTRKPEEIIVVISHKDSQSWIDCPGANDNAIGTVCNLELARILSGYESERSLWFIWCNEEHTPWTSVTAANNAKARGDKVIAVFNMDSCGRKSPEDTAAGKKINVSAFAAPEGEALADLLAEVNDAYGIGLDQRKAQRPQPGDDDGSYVKAGYPAALINLGSFPYADPNYHLETDTAETVDIPNAAMTTQMVLAAIVKLDRGA